MTKTRTIVALGIAALLSFTMSAAAFDGRIPAGMEVTTIDLPGAGTETGAEATACPAQKEGQAPATLAAYRDFAAANGVTPIEMSLSDFGNDPDILMVMGSVPANMLFDTVVFADPRVHTDFVLITVLIYDENGCFFGSANFDPALVVKALDGKISA